MMVNGFLLPKYLQRLLEQGKWKKPPNPTVLSRITGSQYADEFTFLTIEGMKQESYPVHLIEDDKLAKIYSLGSSKKWGRVILNDEILDIDTAVFIAVNWHEEAICLDYRFSHEDPRVVAFILENEDFAKWKVIAPDFDSFALPLGL